MFLFPGAVLLQLPAVNDVAVQDEFLAGVISQKLSGFLGFRSGGTEMNIRKHNCSELCT